MIKVTYTITFADKLNAAMCFMFPEDIAGKFSLLSAAAEKLGCVVTVGNNLETKETPFTVTITHTWPNAEARERFLDLAETMIDYQTFFQDYKNHIANSGGDLVITVEELA